MVELCFKDPHPLGLPADRYSHPIHILGKGSFGKVYLCCLRTQLPPSLPTQTLDIARTMSVNLDAHPGASGAPHFSTNPTSWTTSHAHCSSVAPSQPEYSYQWVAVKISKPLVQCDLRSLEYLKREVVCQCKLKHEHVIGFREMGTTSDLCLFLALEFADSGNLQQWLADRGGRVPEATARWFVQQLVYGLAYCHAYGVCNRDIKPDNLLLHTGTYSQPLLKIADFGLCKSSSDSAPNSLVGSPNYMAPEVFSGAPYDGQKADVFSCGVVLYRMVFGTLPFNRTLDGRALTFARNLQEILENMQRELWPKLLPPGVVIHNPSGCGSLTSECPGQPTLGPPEQQQIITPSASLLNLLYGMLRYNPYERMSLYDVKRHDWYREGLTEETHLALLSVDGHVSQGSCQPETAQGCGQSVDQIEAEFGRLLARCAALQQAAAVRAVEEAVMAVGE